MREFSKCVDFKTLLPVVSAFSICILLMISACKKDHVDSHFPAPPFDTVTCDTNNVSYSDSSTGMSVKQVIGSYCTATCHNNRVRPDSSGGIILTEYEGLKEAVDHLSLAGAIKQNGAVMPMPPNGEKMDACSLAIVLAWINQGAKNN